MNTLSVIPFLVILFCIAAIGLFGEKVHHWWENNLNKLKVSLVLGVPVLAYEAHRHLEHVQGTALAYTSFMILLTTLFVITGGIRITGDLEAKPSTNLAILVVGTLLASFVGTTGACMLMIRFLHQTNQERQHTTHTYLFFIFTVGNCAGLLTPLGDPPLLMGYLRGVPFSWTFGMWREWLVVNGSLLSIYYLLDRRAWKKEDQAHREADRTQIVPLRVIGWGDIGLLGVVVLTVAFGNQLPVWFTAHGDSVGARELVLLLIIVASRVLERYRNLYFGEVHSIRQQNEFSLAPMAEVGALFLGIFATMGPALYLLFTYGPHLGIESALGFHFAAGIPSAGLDNAPSYLAATEMAKGVFNLDSIALLPDQILRAISTGAVFFGGMTPIGNAPNLMVLALLPCLGGPKISVKTYLKYSGGILLPIVLVNAFIFY